MSGQYKQQKFKFTDENMQIPRNYDLEREVLGELLILGEEAITNFDSTITPKTFYNENHSIVYATMLKLVKQKKPLDLINLAMQLKADDKLDYIGGSSYLSGLISKVASTAHIKQHIEQLRQYEVNRDLFCLSEEVKVLANDPTSDSSDTIEFIEKSLTDLRVSNKSCALTMTDSISVFYDWLQTNMEHKSTIPTGLKSLDKILNGGFKSPDLIILGGRPSMGKTQFSTFFAEEAAKLGKHVYFVSIEMTAMQLVARMAAREGISYSNMRQGRLTSSEWSMIDSRASKLQQLRINIADSPDCRQLSYIKSEARLLKRKGELDIMFVDYLGLIKTNMRFEKRYIEVGYITGELKALAKELQIPIILLAQLSRPPQGREKETPKMEALRESGDIEQDADIIIFPHRPYVYDSTAVDEMGRSWKDRGVLLIEKNREGQRNVKCFFENDPQFKNFWDDEQANEKLDNTTA